MSASTGGASSPADFCARHFAPLAAGVLALTLFNLTFHITDSAITEWDESLYGLSAAEMVESGDWIVTRLNGEVDYNVITKPPLFVWLTALSFKTLGVTPLALRLTSIVSAWITILVLMLWARRAIDPATAIVAGVVLATSFGFMYAHSGRTGNTDALFALLTTLLCVISFTAFRQPWARLALGLVLAAAFLLRGPGVLMLFVIVAGIEACHRRAPRRWLTLAAAVPIFVVPVSLWMLARWRADGPRFLTQLWKVDLVTRTLTSFEGHSGTPLYYFDILQRYHYDWLAAALVGLILFPPSKSTWRDWLTVRFDSDPVKIVVVVWALVTFGVPTLMQTKLSWYINPFYPAFAIAIGALLHYAIKRSAESSRGRRAALVAIIVMALGTAEGKMLYQVFRRDKEHALQGLLEHNRAAVAGQTVYRSQWNFAEQFVATRLIGARFAYADDVGRFVDSGRVGDFFLTVPTLTDERLQKIAEGAGEGLYRRVR